MTQIKIPELPYVEQNDNNIGQVAALAELLRKAAYNWALEQAVADAPVAAGVVGAAFYAAVWSLSESLSSEKQMAMRFACYATLISNDELSVALEKTSSQLPN